MQHFRLNDLKASKVTLYPSFAQVSRRLDHLLLQPGINEIEIVGFSPDTNSQSLRAETSGDVLVVDTVVDRIVNPEKWIEPTIDQPDEQIGDRDGQVDDPKPIIPPQADELSNAIQAEDDKILIVNDQIDSIHIQYGLLEKYCSSITAANGSNQVFAEASDLYHSRRDALTHSRMDKKLELAELQNNRKRLEEKEREIMSQYERELNRWEQRQREDPVKAKAKREADDRIRRRQETIKDQRDFFPKFVYRVMITLEVPIDTPASSRRSSISSQTVTEKPSLSSKGPIDSTLTLTYVVNQAHWTPRYDLTLSTMDSKATLVYRAELVNATSETWEDVEVTLSTSHASFKGLHDEAPSLEPWHLHIPQSENAQILQAPLQYAVEPDAKARFLKSAPAAGASQMTQFRGASSLFGGASHSADQSVAQAVAPATRARRRVTTGRLFGDGNEGEEDDCVTGATGSASTSEDFEDQGMSMFYVLPHKKTLAPSRKERRHRITTLEVQDVKMIRTAVPKMRKAVFLQAQFTNPSSTITLLKAPAGLTLDGVFLGNTILNHTSPEAEVTLPLGADPSIPISYAKPSVKQSETSGLFTKNEIARTYTRRAVITNTRNVSVQLDVYDQIPISDDEKIKVTLNKPAGLSAGSGAIKAGRNGKEGAKSSTTNWGSATCRLDNNGGLKWKVALNKGCACALDLEYDVRSPPGENVASKV